MSTRTIKVEGDNMIAAFNAAAIAVLKRRGQLAEDAVLADAQIAAICGRHRSAYSRWRAGQNITLSTVQEILGAWADAGYPEIRIESGAEGSPFVARVEVR